MSPVHAPGVYERLAAAVRRLQKAAGGLEGAAAITGRSVSQHGRYQDPRAPDQLPLNLICDLETEAGQPTVSRALAEVQGYRLVPVKAAAALGPEWPARVVKVTHEAAEALAALSQAAADGEVSAAESRALRVRGEIAEAIEALATVDRLLAELEDG